MEKKLVYAFKEKCMDGRTECRTDGRTNIAGCIKLRPCHEKNKSSNSFWLFNYATNSIADAIVHQSIQGSLPVNFFRCLCPFDYADDADANYGDDSDDCGTLQRLTQQEGADAHRGTTRL